MCKRIRYACLTRYIRCIPILIWLSIAVLVVFGLSPQPVSACTPTAAPPGYIPPTPVPFAVWVADAAPRAKLIVEATVLGRVDSPGLSDVWEVEVSRYLKGHGPRLLQMQFAAPCMGNGDRGLLFLAGDSQATTPVQYQAFYPSDIPVDATLIDTVINVVRQPPTFPEQSSVLNQPSTRVWIALLSLILVGGGWFVWQRRKHA